MNVSLTFWPKKNSFPLLFCCRTFSKFPRNLFICRIISYLYLAIALVILLWDSILLKFPDKGFSLFFLHVVATMLLHGMETLAAFRDVITSG